MPDSIRKRLEDAWNALWREGGPYNLPDALQHGYVHGPIHVKAVNRVSFPDTGPLTLFKQQPWGGVSINLRHNLVTGLPSVTNGGFSYDPKTETCKVRLALPQPRLFGSLCGAAAAPCVRRRSRRPSCR